MRGPPAASVWHRISEPNERLSTEYKRSVYFEQDAKDPPDWLRVAINEFCQAVEVYADPFGGWQQLRHSFQWTGRSGREAEVPLCQKNHVYSRFFTVALSLLRGSEFSPWLSVFFLLHFCFHRSYKKHIF